MDASTGSRRPNRKVDYLTVVSKAIRHPDFSKRDLTPRIIMGPKAYESWWSSLSDEGRTVLSEHPAYLRRTYVLDPDAHDPWEVTVSMVPADPRMKRP